MAFDSSLSTLLGGLSEEVTVPAAASPEDRPSVEPEPSEVQEGRSNDPKTSEQEAPTQKGSKEDQPGATRADQQGAVKAGTESPLVSQEAPKEELDEEEEADDVEAIERHKNDLAPGRSSEGYQTELRAIK